MTIQVRRTLLQTTRNLRVLRKRLEIQLSGAAHTADKEYLQEWIDDLTDNIETLGTLTEAYGQMIQHMAYHNSRGRAVDVIVTVAGIDEVTRYVITSDDPSPLNK